MGGRRHDGTVVAVDEVPPGPAILEAVLSSPSSCKLKEGPRVKVRVTNTSEQDIYLIQHLDGSDERWRHPHCYFEITPPAGAVVYGNGGRCKFMSPLTAEDFVLLRAGESFDPFSKPQFFHPDKLPADVALRHHHDGLFNTPGVYRLRFVYSTASADLRDYAGTDRPPGVENKPEIAEMFKKVPHTVVKSNEILVTVLLADDPPHEDPPHERREESTPR